MAEHRQRAVATVWLAAFCGVVAAAALLALARGSRSLQAAAVATALALLVLSAASATWTAAAGHRIRHAEISMTPPR
jgi:hypothetical protein